MDRLREEALHDVSTARGEQEYEVASDDSAANSIASDDEHQIDADLADFLGATSLQ